MRDYTLEDTFDIKFTTRRFSTGAPFTLAGTPVISAYPDNDLTQLTAGITLTVDFDGVTGLNNVRVVATSGNGYAAGSTYALVITTGTVDGVSVVGEVIGEFTLGRSAAAVDLANGTDGLGALSADIATRLASADITLTAGKVTPIDVDGLTHAKAMEVIMAVLLNVAAPSGSTVVFKKRDGTTTTITVTYGTVDGERTASVIA